MDFSEAEEKFQELQARVQRGEPLSEDQYQEEMQKLMVQDERGTFWSLEPGTGQWLYFNGTEWVPGTPPRPKPPAQPAPYTPPPAQPSAYTPPGDTASAAAGAYTASAAEAFAESPVEAPAVEPETVPAYERAEEQPAVAPGGIAPRPVRGTTLPFAEENTPWLPFAIGAVVLLFCAIALFFGVRYAPFFGSAVPKATATTIVAIAPSPTEVVTEAPTAAPQPSATAAPPTAAAPQATTVTLTDRVRVRGGPGTNFNVITTLDSGTALTAVGRNADGSWIQVQLPGKTDPGWVSAQFVTVSGDVNSLPVVSAPTKSATPTKKASSRPTATETPAG